jgi:acyl-CoA hydrolase
MSEIYDRVARDDTFFFRPVNETHDICAAAATPSFVAINAAMEIDLFGQINSESQSGQLLSGVGGMPPFVQASVLSSGGRSIFCLSSSADGGRISRVVPRLGLGSITGMTRTFVDTVVTEHGAADLRGLCVEKRAESLIGLSAPQFRDELAAAWRSIRAAF